MSLVSLFHTLLLDDLLPSCTAVDLRASISSQLVAMVGFHEDTIYGASESADSYQCYQVTASPSNMDWVEAYKKDTNTKVIFLIFQ